MVEVDARRDLLGVELLRQAPRVRHPVRPPAARGHDAVGPGSGNDDASHLGAAVAVRDGRRLGAHGVQADQVLALRGGVQIHDQNPPSRTGTATLAPPAAVSASPATGSLPECVMARPVASLFAFLLPWASAIAAPDTTMAMP